jgi:D-serine deaminase-like pyridoxal phosphate-dependent protein
MISEIDTPALLIDLDAMERNISTLASFFKGKKGKAFRPHFKTPKAPVIAWKEIRSGAIGISCQKVSAAEVLVSSGINDLLITNEVVGARKIRKMIGLRRHAPGLMVCVDNIDNARATSEEALRKGVKMAVLVDVNVGQNRCGVEPGKPAVELAKGSSKLRGLEFKGIQVYNGRLQMLDQWEDTEAKNRAIDHSNELTVMTREAIEDAGMDVKYVSGAGTGTYQQQYEFMTEVQAGSYPLMDWRYHISAPEFDRALSVLTTVISTPSREKAVVDCGYKCASTDSGMPIVKDVEGVEYRTAGDEHGILSIQESSTKIKLGDKVELYPSHCDTTINLYDKYYGMRDGEVEIIWDIVARGKSQ